MLTCGVCGTVIEDEQGQACPGCGEPLARMAPSDGAPSAPTVPAVPFTVPDGATRAAPPPPSGPPHPDQIPAAPETGPEPVAASARRRRVVPAVVLVTVVLALAVGGVVVASRGSQEPRRSTSGDEETDGVDEPQATATTDGAAEPSEDQAAVDEAPEVTCPTDAATPDLVRFWQDDAGIHVVVTITSQCEADQVVDDAAARFGLFVGVAPLVTGTFDLSGDPIALPAGGTSGELELLFDAAATIDHQLRAQVYLAPSEATAGTDGLDLRYVVRCEQSPGGASTGGVTSKGPASLDTAPAVAAGAAAPTVPPPFDPTADGIALAAMEAIHAADAGAREGLRNQWVPQVSAKRLDAEATRDVFTGQEMVHTARVFLDKLRAWEARYGDRVVLLRGSDFPSICGSSQSAGCLALWIVAIAEPRSTPEAVFFDWCGPEGLNTIAGVPITDTTELNCAAYRYSDDTETPDSFVG